jgi:two-component system, cell cycle sensor histidine kinase and response regulator CckA
MLTPTRKTPLQGLELSPPVGPSGLATSRVVEHGQLVYSIDVAKKFSRQMAHDFNNILAVIQGFAAILQSRLQQDEANRVLAEQIDASATEALKLTTWLSSFGNSQADEFTELDLNQVVARFLSQYRDHQPPGVELEVGLEDQLPPLMGDEAQLEQVCRNLWQNAVEAMPEGGVLRWQTSLLWCRQDHPLEAEGSSLVPYLRLRVSDTGTGMDEETQGLMFQPIFTTKTGKARGLGLTLAYDIARAHNGFIEVSTLPGAGTCVDMNFPAQIPASVQTQQKPAATEEQKPHKLLVVDDEAMVRRMLQELLKGLGYDVVSVGSGEAAVAAYRQSPEEISAVILDMSLPGMSGRDTFRCLKELNHRVKVIITTGDPHQQAVHDAMAQGACGIVSKPFRTDHLADVIKQALVSQ